MKTTQLKIGKRTFALAFNMNALFDMQDTIPEFDLSKLTSYTKSPRGMIDLIIILARQGEQLEGRALDVDHEWFGRHLSPSPKQIAKIQQAVLGALTDGLTMESEDDEEAEHDVVLEEIKKKEETGG